MGRVRQEGKKRNLVCVNTIDSAIWDFPCTINELNMGERTFAYRKFRPMALGRVKKEFKRKEGTMKDVKRDALNRRQQKRRDKWKAPNGI